MSISTLVGACLNSFNNFVKRLDALDDATAIAWQDELGRLRIWIANIGAHQQGQLSLDFRLRDSSHIREQIVQLFRDLQKVLKDAEAAITKTDHKKANHVAIEEARQEDDQKTERQEVFEEAAVIINCLYQMSTVVRQPVRHDRIVESSSINTSHFEAFDREHVTSKFPRADGKLTKRLGMAITKRRRYLKYRERHHTKLAHGLAVAEGETVDEFSTLSPTVITAEQNHQSAIYNDNSSEGAFSQTTYGSDSIAGRGPIKIPQPPKGWVSGVPFECPYCYFLIEVKHKRSWDRHVFKDLQPYTCIFQTCSLPDKMFESRHEWFNHELVAHRDEWLVPLGNQSSNAYPGNSGSDAGDMFTHSSKAAHVALIQSFFICPLCLERFCSQQFEKHVARHLEELALFALPYTERDLDDKERHRSSPESSDDENESWNDVTELIKELAAPERLDQLASSAQGQSYVAMEEDAAELQARFERLMASLPEFDAQTSGPQGTISDSERPNDEHSHNFQRWLDEVQLTTGQRRWRQGVDLTHVFDPQNKD